MSRPFFSIFLYLFACGALLAQGGSSAKPGGMDVLSPGMSVLESYLAPVLRNALEKRDADQLPVALAEATAKLQLAEQKSGKESMEVARARMELAIIHIAMGNIKVAMEWAEKGVGLEQIVGDKTSVDYALGVQVLGRIYAAAGEFMPAKRAFSHAHDVLKGKFHANDPRMADILYDLGYVSSNLNLPESRSLLLGALRLQEPIAKVYPLAVAWTMTRLAQCCATEKDFANAELYGQRVVSMLSNDAKEHGEILTTLFGAFMVMYMKNNEFGKAEARLLALENTIRQHFPEDKRYAAIASFNRAVFHHGRGDNKQAEQSFLICIQHLPQNDPQGAEMILDCMLALASIALANNEVDKAERLLTDLRNRADRIVAPGTEKAAQINTCIGIFLMKEKKDYAGAESYLRSSFKIRTEKLGKAENPEVLLSLAYLCAISNRKSEARSFLRQVLSDEEARGTPSSESCRLAREFLNNMDLIR